jgi:hypothetical protein
VVEFGSPGRRSIHDSVSVIIGEKSNPGEWCAIIGGERIVAHFGNKHPTFFIPDDIDRVAGEGLGGDELNFIVSVNFPGSPALFRGEGEAPRKNAFSCD